MSGLERGREADNRSGNHAIQGTEQVNLDVRELGAFPLSKRRFGVGRLWHKSIRLALWDNSERKLQEERVGSIKVAAF